MAVYHVSNFAGGMNEIIHPGLLTDNQARLLLDADVISGKIQAAKHPLKTIFSSPLDVLHFGNRNRSVVKWYDRYYWSDNVALTYSGNAEALGVPYPEEMPKIVKEKYEPGLTGIYKYAITFVNKNGWESAPGTPSNYYIETELAGEYARLTLPVFPKGIEYAKIYRTIAEGAEFLYVGELHDSNGMFIDRMDDITASMQSALNTFDDFPPPKNGRYLTEAGSVFFLAVGSNLYYSQAGNPHAWPKTNFIGMGDVITGICAEFQGVLVFTQNNTCRVIGADTPETITKIGIPGNQGCVNYRSIATLANCPIWLSNDGICIWDGNNISIISMRIMDTHRLPLKCAVSANDVYYLFGDKGTICYDRRNGGIFYRLSETCDYAWYDGNTDRLYIQKEDGIYIFGEGGEKSYTYISPDIGGSDLVYKKIIEVIVNAEGAFTLTVTGDGNSICSIAVNSKGRHRIKMPHATTARNISLKVIGTGGLNEISLLYV